MNSSALPDEVDLFPVCEVFNAKLGPSKIKSVNAVEFIGGVYYLIMAVLGFRNIYVLFYKQKKIETFVFPTMYLFSQAICILQSTQCFMFFKLNGDLLRECHDKDSHAVPFDKALHWLTYF